MRCRKKTCGKVIKVLFVLLDEVGKLKKFRFRMQVVLDMREKELEARQMEMAKILAALNEQQEKLNSIILSQEENKNKTGGDKMKTKLESEKKELEKLMKEINDNNANREEIINQIEELKAEIFDLPTVGRTYMGVDGRGYIYYHFIWMPNVLFIRVKNDKGKRKEKS